ncbi:DNA polymerase Y family protein [Plantibacter sp. CFBP 8798]|uniref:DNA polymerase Y family protein n=1 Tax=Plantibacter sp. CFBP 8798 TaxID=2775268 RepID=UPI001783A9BD|nr:DNA polymerase Y family protein [Plantibacter sp. CFBP 8798]MBD8466722.1 DNA polymerase Y family protein [Plantibacter sp. CFBP 8798]
MTTEPPAGPVERTMVLWCPDWPIVAARLSGTLSEDTTDAPLALIEHGEVLACDATARRAGVRRGLRVREAEARCPELATADYDPVVDARAFEPILLGIEELMPGVQPFRAGLCAIRSRGPSRYYGGESAAAEVLLARLDELGVPDARIGIADGPFAAEQAARSTAFQQDGSRIIVIPSGASPAFLAPLPLSTLGRPELSSLLHRLGISTLGAFGALPATEVRDRFGPDGARAHRLAAGADARSVVPRVPPTELAVSIAFEPPLDRIDQLTFGFRQSAERFITGLAEAGLVTTAITISMRSERGERSTRTWLHPRWFTAGDVLDRVRWQLQGASNIDHGLASPVELVEVVPETLDDAAEHEEGLWGSGPDERIHSGLARVQSMLGHDGVVTAVPSGGRLLLDRRILVPWGSVPPGGEAAVAERRNRPWPGTIPGAAPSTVFDTAVPVEVVDATGLAVAVDERSTVSAAPARFFALSDWHVIDGWAGPWSIDERWWDDDGHHRVHRLQVLDDSGEAWLLLLEEQHWRAEARYD